VLDDDVLPREREGDAHVVAVAGAMMALRGFDEHTCADDRRTLEPFSLACSERPAGIRPNVSRSSQVLLYEEVRTALGVELVETLPDLGLEHFDDFVNGQTDPP